MVLQKGKNMIKAVVFDMDGVLFDTERLISKVWVELAKEEGIEAIEAVLMDCIGRSYEDTRGVFFKAYGQDFGFDEFRKKAGVRFHQAIKEHGLPIKIGVHELLAHLKEKGYKIGLASSTKQEVVREHLKEAKIEDYFEVVIGGDMVKQSKPDPEIYERACKELGVEPREAICIEDSLNGIRSASAAGLNVIMVPDLIQPTEEILPLLHKRFGSLLEVKHYLEEV